MWEHSNPADLVQTPEGHDALPMEPCQHFDPAKALQVIHRASLTLMVSISMWCALSPACLHKNTLLCLRIWLCDKPFTLSIRILHLAPCALPGILQH